jgi:hypothetical protein
MNVFAQPALAVVFGAFILCAETCLHFESLAAAAWLEMPWHDWLAGLWLVIAGLRARTSGLALSLTSAWAFMLSLLVSVFFWHLAEWWKPASSAPNHWLSEGALLGWLTALTVTAGCAWTGLLRAQSVSPPPGLLERAASE